MKYWLMKTTELIFPPTPSDLKWLSDLFSLPLRLFHVKYLVRMYSTQHSTIYMGTKIIKKLEFKNPDIFKHQSDFTGKDGNQLKRVYTSFKMKKTTAFRGLCLCEYLKGEKHFVIRFYFKKL